MTRMRISGGAGLSRLTGWTDRRAVSLVGFAQEQAVAFGVALVIVQLGACFTVTWLLGGAGTVPPHWYYLPVLFAGVRFGFRGAIVTALAAAVLAGPLLPSDVGSGTAQAFSDWATRGGFFLLVGVVLPVLMRTGTETIQEQRKGLRTEAAIRQALTKGEFLLHYQPIVAVDDQRIIGAEALLRWAHPERGLLHPADFLADVERVGSITTWVLEEATRTAATWTVELGLERFSMAVNVSPDKLAQPDLVSQVRGALAASGLRPDRLCIEVTESGVIHDIDTASARLQALRSLGVRIAIDDFGTGHSALVHLQQLPVDIVKIDRGFVADLGIGRRGGRIADAIAALAPSLGATCVAEGVETEGQLDAVRGLGCHAAQGYLFSRPVPEAAFRDLLVRGEPLFGPLDGRRSAAAPV
jgi:EAL domain-containing protein (putative c-di-GMP-specific phosphodiesterase class I)